MRIQSEADRDFLALVQGSLLASAKEAERLATFTGTRLVRIDSTQPAVPKGLMETLLNDCHGEAHSTEESREKVLDSSLRSE